MSDGSLLLLTTSACRELPVSTTGLWPRQPDFLQRRSSAVDRIPRSTPTPEEYDRIRIPSLHRCYVNDPWDGSRHQNVIGFSSAKTRRRRRATLLDFQPGTGVPEGGDHRLVSESVRPWVPRWDRLTAPGPAPQHYTPGISGPVGDLPLVGQARRSRHLPWATPGRCSSTNAQLCSCPPLLPRRTRARAQEPGKTSRSRRCALACVHPYSATRAGPRIVSWPSRPLHPGEHLIGARRPSGKPPHAHEGPMTTSESSTGHPSQEPTATPIPALAVHPIRGLGTALAILLGLNVALTAASGVAALWWPGRSRKRGQTNLAERHQHAVPALASSTDLR